MPIRDLDDERFPLRDPSNNPIYAYITSEDEQYKVEVPELEAFAFADCVQDAMIGLVAEIVQMCEEVLVKPDAQLGRGARLWKGFLQSRIAIR